MISEHDVIDILAEIARLDDRRKFDKDHVETWTRVARHANWTKDGAISAVVAHAAENKRWISPADITAYLRDPDQTGERRCEY